MNVPSRAGNLPVFLLLGIVLAGCAAAPHFSSNHRAGFRVGRPNYTVAPYQVNGVWYHPRADYSYDKTGTASWYGEQFNERATSDGEIFDMNQLSAAHKTLPLPSVVEVTNLQNGRELRLRVNDRGPFVGDRLIDVSRRAAQLLGFERSGTAPVRVRILKDESIQVAEAAMRGGYGPVGTAVASQAEPTELAAAAPVAPPRHRPPPVVQPPVIQMAAAEPAPLRPPPSEIRAAPVRPEPARAPAPAMMPREAEPAAPALPREPAFEAEMMRRQPPPPRPAFAAAARYHWPSLIASAHAATLRRRPAFMRQPVPVMARQSGRIFIQAGAFAVLENAQRVRARIAGLGRVEVMPMGGRRSPLYRVRLGPVTSTAAAARLLSEVVSRGYPGARVVKE